MSRDISGVGFKLVWFGRNLCTGPEVPESLLLNDEAYIIIVLRFVVFHSNMYKLLNQ